MLLEIQFWWRNHASNKRVSRVASELNRTVRESYAYGKAMREFRKIAKTDGKYICFHCRKHTNLHIHHIVPVSVAPSLACDHDNFILACSKHHFSLCHNGNWQHYTKDPIRLSRDIHLDTIITTDAEA